MTMGIFETTSRKTILPRINDLHIAIRAIGLGILLWEFHQVQAVLLGIPISWELPAALALTHFLIASAIILIPWDAQEVKAIEPFLVFSDFLTAGVLLYLYNGDFSCAIPLFFATYTASASSWNAAFFVALGGSVFFLLESISLHGLFMGILDHPSWLLVLLLNLSISPLGLVQSELTREREKMTSLISLLQTNKEPGSMLTYESLFELAATTAKSIFSAGTYAIYLLEGEMLKLHRTEGAHAKFPGSFDPKASKSLLNEVIHSQTAKLCLDLHEELTEQEKILPRTKYIRCAMIAPFLFENNFLGIFFLAGSSPNLYDAQSLKLFSVLADQTAVALHNIQLSEKTAEMAVMDSVSGAYTHGHMQETLEREFHRAKYNNLPLSLIIFDVDHFKEINDTYGHPQGDMLLRQLIGVAKQETRSYDLLCRYGGDEFLLVLPETHRMGAVLVAERMRKAVEQYEFVLSSKVIHISISIGVAEFPEDAPTKEELIRKTDLSLYDAKRQGRNKVCFSTA